MTLVLRDAASGQTWSLVEGRLVIGRKNAQPQADHQSDDVLVLLDDGLVSRAHAVIRAEGNRFTVTDTDSRDGTYINDREVTESTQVHDGDRLRLGDTVLVASIAHAAPPPPSRGDGEQTVFQRSPRAQALDAEKTLFQASPPPPTRSERATQERAAPQPVVPRPVTAQPAGTRPSKVTPRPVTPPVSVAPAITPPPAPAIAPPSIAPPNTDPPPRIVVTVPGSQAEHSAVAPRLPELRRSADELAAALAEFDQDLATAVEMFERNGGRAALQTFLAHAQRIATEPRNAEDLQAFFSWLPTGCRLLEVELIVMNLLSSRASDAPR